MILTGHCVDVIGTLPEASVQAVVTSPPYRQLRDYGSDPVRWSDGWVGKLGEEGTPSQFVEHLIEVFRSVRRVLKPNGTMWVNLGDTYVSSRADPSVRPRSLAGIPWRFALAMMADGWILRQEIIWEKPNAMPEPPRKRCTRCHEHIFLFSLDSDYVWNHSAMQEPAIYAGTTYTGFAKWRDMPGHGGLRYAHENGELRIRRSVWRVAHAVSSAAHFAQFPPDLVRPMIQASTREGDTVLDPFSGAGTTVLVAEEQGRIGIGIEINPAYVGIAEQRIPLRLNLMSPTSDERDE